jgi:hypothetical protein
MMSSDRIPKMILKYQPRGKRSKEEKKTFEKMEGFSFVTPVTGLSGPNAGKEDDELRSVHGTRFTEQSFRS